MTQLQLESQPALFRTRLLASSGRRRARIPVARERYPGEYLLRIARDPLAVFVELAREYGDIVRIPMGPQGFVLVAHPELAREVLVTRPKTFVRGYAHRGLSLLLGEGLLTSQGDFHRHQRRLAQPAFHAERLVGYGETVVANAERWDARWSAREHTVVDVHDEMLALTLGIVGETLFGAHMESQTSAIAEALGDALSVGPAALVPFSNWLLRLPIPPARRLRRAKHQLDGVVSNIIADRRAGGEDRDDLLSILLDATRSDDPDQEAMSDQQLADEVMPMFVAGYETTATAMSWTWYLLGRHPEIAGRLRTELDTVLGTGAAARSPRFDDVPRLPYTRAVLAESMRLFPPAYSVVRVCTERSDLGGHTIEAGWSVATSSYLAHHDPRWWPEPERFDPERWLGPDQHSRRKMTYFPFGAGTRICIGEPFTWTETTLVLATLGHRWDPQPASAEPVRPHGSITMRPDGPIRMRLERATRS